MKKEQSIPSYLGHEPDGLFHNYSGGVAKSICDSEEKHVALYWAHHAQRATASYDPDYWGSELIDYGVRPKPWFNDCHHVRTRGINVPFGLTTAARSPTMVNIMPYWRYNATEGYTIPITSHINAWDGGVRRRAWWHMQPRFEGEISMINFLLELSDFKSLLKFALKGRDKKYYAIRKKCRQLLAEPSRAGAEGWLSYNLAIKPLIGDLLTIHMQMLEVVREVQDAYAAAGLDAQTSHYSELTGEELITVIAPYNSKTWRRGAYSQSLFTATMQYYYAYRMRSTVDAFLHYWGLGLSAETIWNTIPFGFVADYFIKIGDSLHAMRQDPHTDLRLNQYCESMKSITHHGHWIEPHSSIHYLMVNGKLANKARRAPIAGMSAELYDRRITSPLRGPALPRIKWPSGHQKTTMAALVRCMI